MSEERPKAVAAVPWLRIEKEAKVGHIRFAPFNMRSPADLRDHEEVSRRLSIFREIEKDQKTGEPLLVGRCTIIMLDGQGPLGILTEDDWPKVVDAIQTFCFACLAANKYLTFPGQVPYVNTSCLQPYYLGDFSVFPLRKRD